MSKSPPNRGEGHTPIFTLKSAQIAIVNHKMLNIIQADGFRSRWEVIPSNNQPVRVQGKVLVLHYKLHSQCESPRQLLSLLSVHRPPLRRPQATASKWSSPVAPGPHRDRRRRRRRLISGRESRSVRLFPLAAVSSHGGAAPDPKDTVTCGSVHRVMSPRLGPYHCS
jgi:hypothetical protein